MAVKTGVKGLHVTLGMDDVHATLRLYTRALGARKVH